MAEIEAFRGLRYDLGHVGDLSDVVAPPYDVIDGELQDALYKKHPCNVVRLILNREEPGDDAASNRYTRAASFLRQWKQQGVLVEEGEPALYVYHQEFEHEGRRVVRRGFMARCWLEAFGTGKIFPHEETMPGPKADRLRLMEATETNLSQIFGLYNDAGGEVQAVLEEQIARRIPLEATDHLGVVHRMWPVSDQRAISRVRGLMGPRAVFIADGHHRYETALRYAEGRREAMRARGGAPPHPNPPPQGGREREEAWNFVLMMFVAMSDPGLIVLPTHRLVSGLGGLTGERLEEALAEHFEVEQVGSAEDAWEIVEAEGAGRVHRKDTRTQREGEGLEQRAMGLGTAADGRWYVARLRDRRAMQEAAPQRSVEWRGLAVSVLHELVLGRALRGAGSDGPPSCRYVHQLEEVLAAVGLRGCDLACLVPPARLEHIERISSRREKLPPKSTYFYPKLLSGLVFHSLR